MCVSARKATRKYGFREEMCSRACATSGNRISCISKRKAPRALQFLNEIDYRRRIFLRGHNGAAAISLQNRGSRCYGGIAPQPESRPCHPPWSGAFEPLDLLFARLSAQSRYRAFNRRQVLHRKQVLKERTFTHIFHKVSDSASEPLLRREGNSH